MHAFTDSTGLPWSIALTIASVKRVRERLGIDLLNLFDGTPPLLTRLSDPLYLCDVVYCLVEEQALALQPEPLDSETFAKHLGGEAITNCHDAFFAELRDFFQSLRRPETVKAIEKHRDLMASVLTAAAEKVETLMDQAAEQAHSALGQISGASSGNSPVT